VEAVIELGTLAKKHSADIQLHYDALIIHRIFHSEGDSIVQLADRIGKSRPAIANTLRLLNLAPEVIKLVANNDLSAGHARAIITMPETDQVKLAKEIIKSGMSVRDVENRVKDFFTPPEEKIKQKPKIEQSAELKEFINRMQRILGTKVNAIGNDNKGRIYIDYYMREDLDRISDILDFVEKNHK
jgi:ParB family chromosome partitioning protein